MSTHNQFFDQKLEKYHNFSSTAVKLQYIADDFMENWHNSDKNTLIICFTIKAL